MAKIVLLFYQNINLIEEIIKDKKRQGAEKTQFRKTMPSLFGKTSSYGQKPYLFCRDLDACKRAAMMYSLFGACKVLDKNPERWLCHVLKNIKTTPKDKLYTLLPEFWEDEEQ